MKLSEFQVSKISIEKNTNADNDMFQDILNIIDEPNSPQLMERSDKSFQLDNIESSSQDDEDSELEESLSSDFLRQLETFECQKEEELQGQLLYLRQ